MKAELRRMWVNQPSTLQPHHKLHGTSVLAIKEYDNTYRVYFLSGPIVSQQMTGLALSEGWIDETRKAARTGSKESQAGQGNEKSHGSQARRSHTAA